MCLSGGQVLGEARVVEAVTSVFAVEKLPETRERRLKPALLCLDLAEACNLGSRERLACDGEYAQDPLVESFPSGQALAFAQHGARHVDVLSCDGVTHERQEKGVELTQTGWHILEAEEAAQCLSPLALFSCPGLLDCGNRLLDSTEKSSQVLKVAVGVRDRPGDEMLGRDIVIGERLCAGRLAGEAARVAPKVGPHLMGVGVNGHLAQPLALAAPEDLEQALVRTGGKEKAHIRWQLRASSEPVERALIYVLVAELVERVDEDDDPCLGFFGKQDLGRIEQCKVLQVGKFKEALLGHELADLDPGQLAGNQPRLLLDMNGGLVKRRDRQVADPEPDGPPASGNLADTLADDHLELLRVKEARVKSSELVPNSEEKRARIATVEWYLAVATDEVARPLLAPSRKPGREPGLP